MLVYMSLHLRVHLHTCMPIRLFTFCIPSSPSPFLPKLERFCDVLGVVSWISIPHSCVSILIISLDAFPRIWPFGSCPKSLNHHQPPFLHAALSPPLTQRTSSSICPTCHSVCLKLSTYLLTCCFVFLVSFISFYVGIVLKQPDGQSLFRNYVYISIIYVSIFLFSRRTSCH